MIHFRNITFTYQKKTIFKDFNASIPCHQWSGITGPSGIGKSTLLNLISGSQLNTGQLNGQILIDSQERSPKQIAYLTQSGTLLPWLKVIDNILLPTILTKTPKTERYKKKQQALELLQICDLAKSHNLYPHQLSGGMHQRVALIRTMIEDKPIILMDEPFASLDVAKRLQLQDLMTFFFNDKTVIFVSHDPIEILKLAHHIFLLDGHPAKLQKIDTCVTPFPRNPLDATLTEKWRGLHARLLGLQAS